MLPMFNVGNAKKMEDLGSVIQFGQLQFIGFFTGLLVPICMFERAVFHVPVSLLYNITFSFGLVSLYYGVSGQNEEIVFVF